MTCRRRDYACPLCDWKFTPDNEFPFKGFECIVFIAHLKKHDFPRLCGWILAAMDNKLKQN